MKLEVADLLLSGDMIRDHIHVMAYLEDYYKACGVTEVRFRMKSLNAMINRITSTFPGPFGKECASPFKKAAWFTANFAIFRPVDTGLPEDYFGELSSHQNTILPVSMCIDALHGAHLKRDGDKEPFVLSERIVLTTHYWREMIAALSRMAMFGEAGPSWATEFGFCTTALIYESLAYQVNPRARYQDAHQF